MYWLHYCYCLIVTGFQGSLAGGAPKKAFFPRRPVDNGFCSLSLSRPMKTETTQAVGFRTMK